MYLTLRTHQDTHHYSKNRMNEYININSECNSIEVYKVYKKQINVPCVFYYIYFAL